MFQCFARNRVRLIAYGIMGYGGLAAVSFQIRRQALNEIDNWSYDRVYVEYASFPGKAWLESVTSPALVRSVSHVDRLILYDVDDETLEAIVNSLKPRDLSIAETNVTDRGILSIRPYARLRALDIRRTSISEETLPHLSGFPGLRELWVAESAIDAQSVVRFKQDNAPCIVFDAVLP